MKVAVVGTAYIGLSNAMLFAQQNGIMAIILLLKKVGL